MRPVVIFFICLFSSSAFAGEIAYSSKQDYIQDWHSIAVRQMISHKIPASITLAQGILESSYGNSDLARLANNHFGIKCHEWIGERVFQDDDTKNECFRKYSTADLSYEDHSTFLTTRSRYGKLFELDITDYKGWAYGLKAAGYATNPKYPTLLIGIIEDYKLYEYDKMGTSNPQIADVSKITNTNKTTTVITNKTTETKTVTEKTKNTPKAHPGAYTPTKPTPKPAEIVIEISDSKVKSNGVMSPFKRTTRVCLEQPNKVKYIIAKKGDTFYKIAEEFELTLSQLHRYNDFPKGKDFLVEGDMVYLQPKRSAAKSLNVVTLNKALSVKEISQAYGVKTSEIVKKNNLESSDVVLAKGKKIKL